MGHHQTLVLAAIQAYKTFINFLIHFSDCRLGRPGLRCTFENERMERERERDRERERERERERNVFQIETPPWGNM